MINLHGCFCKWTAVPCMHIPTWLECIWFWDSCSYLICHKLVILQSPSNTGVAKCRELYYGAFVLLRGMLICHLNFRCELSIWVPGWHLLAKKDLLNLFVVPEHHHYGSSAMFVGSRDMKGSIFDLGNKRLVIRTRWMLWVAFIILHEICIHTSFGGRV